VEKNTVFVVAASGCVFVAMASPGKISKRMSSRFATPEWRERNRERDSNPNMRHAAAVMLQRSYQNWQMRRSASALFGGAGMTSVGILLSMLGMRGKATLPGAVVGANSPRVGQGGDVTDSDDEDEFSHDGFELEASSQSVKPGTDEEHVGKRYLTHAFGPSWGTIVAYRPKIDITSEPESWHVRFDNGLDCYLTRPELDELRKAQGTPKECPRECRRNFVHFVEWEWFDRAILMVILVNCICLALSSPVLDPKSTLASVLNGFDTAFAVIFLTEMILKLLALDYKYFCTIKKGGRMCCTVTPNLWNLLDFVISIEGGIGLTVEALKVSGLGSVDEGGVNLTFLRTLRVFRPLRTITHLPGLKALVEALALSLPLLRDALILISFFFVVFGYMGLELWLGLFRARCFDLKTGLEVQPHIFNACALNNVYVFGVPVGRDCDAGQFCGVSRENYNYGVTSFDNIFVAFITIFQCITLEGWADIMYLTMDIFSPVTVIYFAMLLIFGTFVLLNLLLAVVVSKFGQCKRDMEMQKNKHRTRQLALDTIPVLGQMKLRQFWTRGEHDVSRAIEARARALGKETMARQIREAEERDRKAGVIEVNVPMSKRGKRGNGRQRRLAVHSADVGAKMQSSALFATASVRSEGGLEEEVDAKKSSVAGAAACFARILPKRGAKKAKQVDYPALGNVELHPAAIALVADSVIRKQEEVLYVSQAATFLENDFLPAERQVMDIEGADNDDEFGEQVMSEDGEDPDDVDHVAAEAAADDAEKMHKLDMQREQLSRNFIEWWCFLIIRSQLFSIGLYLCICGNTIVLALDLYPAPAWYEQTLSIANLVFTLIFTVEMCIRILATGISAYLSDRFNVLDGSVTIAGLVEFLLDEDTGVVAFRAARFLRLARLVRYMKSLQEIVSVIQNSLVSVLYVFLLLTLFLFIFAIFGMQAFGGKFDNFKDGLPRNHFDNFHIAFVTVFQILAGENWPAIMYDCVRAQGIVAVLYFIIWVVMGQFILLNLFLAVLMDNFDKIGGQKEKEETDDDDDDFDSDDEEDALPLSDGEDDWVMRRWKECRGRKHCCVPHNWWIVRATTALISYPEDSQTKWFDQFIMVIIIISSVMMAVEGQSFGDAATNNAVELSFLIADIVFTALFTVEVVIKVVALGFCCHEGAYLRDNWNVMDFVVVFTSLLNLGFMALGTLITTEDEETTDAFFSALRILRMARTLRPLRVVNRNPNLRIVIEALAMSIKPLVNVAIVLFLVWFMFALVGVQLMAGKFFACNDPSFEPGMSELGDPLAGIAPCASSWMVNGSSVDLTFIDSDGITNVRQWSNTDINFDNIVNAIIALYIMATGEGWPNIMFAACDVTAVGFQPKRDASWFLAYYFVLFITVTVFFFLELVIGAIFQNFINLKRENNSVVLTDSQRRWVEKQTELRKEKPHRPIFPDELKCCRATTAEYDHWLDFTGRGGGSSDASKDNASATSSEDGEQQNENERSEFSMTVAEPEVEQGRSKAAVEIELIQESKASLPKRALRGYAMFHASSENDVALRDVAKSAAGLTGWAKFWDERESNEVRMLDTTNTHELDRLDGVRGFASYHFLDVQNVANKDVTANDNPAEWRKWAVYFCSAFDPTALKASAPMIASSGRRKSLVGGDGPTRPTAVTRARRASLAAGIPTGVIDIMVPQPGVEWDGPLPEKPKFFECIQRLTHVRRLMYTTVTDLTFDLVIVVLILTNMAVMCCVWYEMTHVQKATVQYANYCFVAIFTAEVIIKTIAMGPVMYLGLPADCCCQKVDASHFETVLNSLDDPPSRSSSPAAIDGEAATAGGQSSRSASPSQAAEDGDGEVVPTKKKKTLMNRLKRKLGCQNCVCHCTVDGWNLFDVIVVSFSILDVIVTVFNTSVLRALRLAKIMRIAKLIRSVKMARLIRFLDGLTVLTKVLMMSLPSMLNVAALLGLLFYIFAILGMNLFGSIEPNMVALNSHANFANIFNSLVTLFRCSTGEDWQDIMYDCINSQIADSNGSWLARMTAYVPAVTYFVAFEFLSSFIVLNLFIMIITENFESTSSNGTEWISAITILTFRENWMAFDSLGTEFIRVDQLKLFLQQIGPPLGLEPLVSFQEYFNFMLDLDLTVYECVCAFFKKTPLRVEYVVLFLETQSISHPRLSLPLSFPSRSGMVNYRELLCQCHGRAYAQRFRDEFMKQLDTLTEVRESVVKDVVRRGTASMSSRPELRRQPEAMLFERLQIACEDSARSCATELYMRPVRPLRFDISATRIQRAWIDSRGAILSEWTANGL